MFTYHTSFDKNLIPVVRYKAIRDRIFYYENEIFHLLGLLDTAWGKSLFRRILIRLEILSRHLKIRKLKRELRAMRGNK